jgi:hypothetical protein
MIYEVEAFAATVICNLPKDTAHYSVGLAIQYRKFSLIRTLVFKLCSAEHCSRETTLPVFSLARPPEYCARDNAQSSQAKHRQV